MKRARPPTTPDAERLLAELLTDFASRPSPVRVVPKRGRWHQHLADRLLKIITFGGQNRYITEYVTTLGDTIYVPDDWHETPALDRYEVLRHEAIHVAQFKRWGWVGMVILYGLVPLPMGLAYGRARLEWEAYEETLRAVWEVEGEQAARDPRLADSIVARFTGPDYAWMWPFERSVRRWIADALDRIAQSA